VLYKNELMNNQIIQLKKDLEKFAKIEGFNSTPVPGVFCIRHSETAKEKTKSHWRACLGILAQGHKEVVLEGISYQFPEGSFTATPVDLPISGRISKSTKEKPFLALLIDMNPLILSELAAQMEADSESDVRSVSVEPIYGGEASEQMLEATLRLTGLFSRPKDAAILGPLIVREIFYHLLSGPQGAGIRQFVRAGSKLHKISQTIYQMKADLQEEIDSISLAKSVGMSRSSFFEYFKEVTSMSPIQYQKRLRLLEAKRLMVEEDGSAESSAFRVGYKSPSQFSREYSRMFGVSPQKDVKLSKS
jgi:AraC-like DNA-binding protein